MTHVPLWVEEQFEDGRYWEHAKVTPYQFRFGRKPRIRVSWWHDGRATYKFSPSPTGEPIIIARCWPDGVWSLIVRGWLHPAASLAEVEQAFRTEFRLAAARV